MCFNLSSLQNFETELETSYRHQDVAACRKASANFRIKKERKKEKVIKWSEILTTDSGSQFSNEYID